VYCRHFAEDDETGARVERFPRLFTGNIRPDLLAGRCPKTVSLFLLRRAPFDAIGGFDPGLRAFQDTDLWLRLSESWDFDAIDQALAVVHSHIGERVTTSLEPRLAGLEAFLSKWGPEMEDVMGSDGVRRYAREHLAVAYGNEIVRLLEAADRGTAMSVAKTYFREVGLTKPRQAAGLIVALLLGPKARSRLKHTSRRFTFE
jgi:hypothetical protein